MRLHGKVAVVIGAAGALGTEISRAFAAEGARALVLADLVPSAIATPGTTHPESEVVVERVDVRDAEAVDALLHRARDELGQVDVLVHNAGALSRNRRMHGLEPSDWRDAVDVNLLGAVNGITSAIRVMRGRGGSIVTTASVAGLTAWPYGAPYGAAKAAVIHVTKVAAVEYAEEGIRVNCVSPGAFSSAMHDGIPAVAREAIATRHPLGVGEPQDLVGAYVYLASDESRWTTGTTVIVDGGYAAP